jgi:EpsI family protein
MKTFQRAGIYIVWAVLFAGILCVHFAPSITPVQMARPFRDFPFEIGGWSGRDRTASDYLAGTLGSDDLLLREYERAGADKVELYMSYFTFTKNKKAPHAPQLCWVGSGWTLKDLGEETVELDCENYPTAVFRKILAERDGERVLLLYLYKINNKYVADLMKFRVIAVFDSVLLRKNSAFTLQLSSQVKGQDLEAKEARMKDLLTKILTIAQKEFLPK